MISDLFALFQRYFDQQPQALIRSPSRVNIIGEHTDYNGGFVLPMALEIATSMAVSRRDDTVVRVMSVNFDQQCAIDLNDLFSTNKDTQHWFEYVKGVAWAMQKSLGQPLRGFDAVVSANVPIGAGLSSSASFEMAIARALTWSNALPWDPVIAACNGKSAENDWVGVNCGIMDQLICAAAQSDNALLIDCQSLATEPVPLPKNTVVVVMDTCARRDLVTSAYNDRRQACEDAAQFFGLSSLRQITLDELIAAKEHMDETAYKRAFHVLMENQRVQAAVLAMKNNDAKALGELMKASHASLDQYFEVTNDALNQIVEIAQNIEGCFGARMTGAGFGGCAVALVTEQSVADFIAEVTCQYRQRTALEAKLYASKAMGGCDIEAFPLHDGAVASHI